MQNQLANLVNVVMDKVKSDSLDWLSNLGLKYEAELTAVVDDILRRYSGELEEIDREISLGKEYKLYSATMDAESRYLSLVEELVKDVVSGIEAYIRSHRQDEAYGRLLEKLLTDAVEVIQSSNLEVICSPKDKDMISSIAGKLNLNLRLVDGPEDMAGIIARSLDGSIAYEATIENVLSRLTDYIRSLIKEALVKVAGL